MAMTRSAFSFVFVVLAAVTPFAYGEEGYVHQAGDGSGVPVFELVLDGFFYHDNQHGGGAELIEEAAGILHGVHGHEHEHGASNGLNLGESEIALTADLPGQLKGRLSLALSTEAVELEEAWLQTQALPGGLALKAGRFLSDIGYLNGQHPHQQEFAGGNLVYGALLGAHGLIDAGVQLTWEAPVPFYLQLGVETLQGHEQERFGALIEAEDADDIVLSGAGLSLPRSGPRSGTFFLKEEPYLGKRHSLQAGVSYAHARQYQQVINEDAAIVDDQFALEGRQQLSGLELVYEYDADGEQGKGDWKLAAEYLQLKKAMRVTGADTTAPVQIGDTVNGTQDGLYVQGMYGIAPRLQLGLRYEVSGMLNELDEAGSIRTFDASVRTSLAVTFRPNPATRLRLQLSSASVSDEAGVKTQLNAFVLGYTGMFGGHEGHAH